MGAINTKFSFTIPSQKSSATISLNLDPEYCISPMSERFLNEIRSNQYFSLSDEGEYSWSCNQFDFNGRIEKQKIEISNKDIEELQREMRFAISNLLFKWNVTYLESQLAKSDNSITDSIKQNNFLLEAYKQPSSNFRLWFDKSTEERMHLNKSDINILIDKLKAAPTEICDLFELPDSSKLQSPKITIFDKIFGSTKRKLIDHETAVQNIESIKTKYEKLNNDIEALNTNVKKTYRAWIDKLTGVLRSVDEQEKATKQTIEQYESGESVLSFFKEVISNSKIVSQLKSKFEIEITESEKHLILNFELPAITKISRAKEYKYLKTRGETKIIEHSDKDFQKLYNDIIYSILFRILNEIFASDYAGHVLRVTFNGWVNSLNKRNGKHEHKFIISLGIDRTTFSDLVLENIDPKLTFRSLKGVSGINLSEMTPINPILQLNKSDSRFVDGYEILAGLDESMNLALMDWEDFEHLVRELFEKEFAATGGEVRVTQSSRDGGVDAIAFDPDPIRGGKIVIQSKRYTNVVGVSAIRDLYGTVMNEGATKGIIVTTSHYGSDAYEFASGKPLTLLDGNNLLAMLEKHGYKARINRNEAKDL